MSLIYALFCGCWRRWFGGGFDKLPDNRFLQHIIGFTGACVALGLCGYHWIQIVFAGLVLQGLFWARSHGDYFFVTSTEKDEGRVKWIDSVLRKIYGEGGYYNFKGNATGMLLRYEAPSILISLILFNFWFLLAGLSVTACYCVCGLLFPKKPYTSYSEYLAGFITGILLTL